MRENRDIAGSRRVGGLRLRTAASLRERTYPLRIRIGTAFIAVVTALGGFTLWFYETRAEAMVATAGRDLLASMQRRVSDDMRALFEPVETLVALTSRLPEAASGDPAARWRLIPFLATGLEASREATSIYVGYANGDFFLLRALDGTADASRGHVPAAARFAAETIRHDAEGRRESVVWLDGRLQPLDRDDRFATDYDPRRRDWYAEALHRGGPVRTELYVSYFEEALTSTVAVPLPDGAGVVGADLFLRSLSRSLDRHRFGVRTQLALFDDEGHVVAHPDETTLVQPSEGSRRRHQYRMRMTELRSPVLVDAYNLFAAGMTEGRAVTTAGGEQWLTAIGGVRFSDADTLHLALSMPRAELLGALDEARRSTLIAATAALLLAGMVAWMMGRSIARPIAALQRESERIGRFELDGEFVVRSRITEVVALTRSMAAMKLALRDFGRYVPKGLVRDLVAGRATTRLGGERRPVTLMFTDVAGFTSLAEDMDPQALMEQVSDYFTTLVAPILDEGGTIDKFIGDAVMAFWNAPGTQPDQIDRACRAALSAAAASRDLDRRFAAEGRPEMFTRFGLHTGEVVVGNLGSQERINYTALGAAVNTAARLEGLNKMFGTQILVSGAVRDGAGAGFVFRRVGEVVPKGAKLPVAIHELLGTCDASGPLRLSADRLEAVAMWEQAVSAYLGRDWDGAESHFSAFRERWPDDALCTQFLERTRAWRRSPPPADWRGIEIMEMK